MFVCFFSGFISYALLWDLRQLSDLSSSTELKKSLDIFWQRLERKRSKEYLVNLLVVKRKLWAIFLSRVQILKNGRHGEAGLKIKLKSARFYSPIFISLSIHVFVNKNCCPFKCFIELYFLSWLFVKISFLSCLSLCWLLFSVTHEHRMQEY